LNGGTARGGAYGFKLDTLGKLESVKGGDNKTTLLDILAKWAVADAPSGPAAPMLGMGEVGFVELFSCWDI
jgi:Formin Homology 2 Domain